ncbi:DUF11 domain-containing protein [Candidatus Peregrinibacteria bacterium]|nr:DUF11 domain-containing protein [Candidatus Peregrinibacteria bacterium]
MSLLFLSGIGGALLQIPLGKASHTDCTDLIDNDADIQIDYPQDPGCTNAEDESETGDIPFVTIALTDGQTEVGPGGSLNYAITLAQDRATFVDVPVQFTLPGGVDFLGASENGFFRDGIVSWNGVTVFQGRPHRLTVFGSVRHGISGGAELFAQVTSGGVSAVDSTTTRALPEPGETSRFSLILSDGLRETKPADTIRYRLEVRRGHYIGETADVVFQLPPFTTLLGASRGASVDRGTVTWPQMSFVPWQTRVFAVTVLVDRSVPEGYALRARAHVGPVRANDETLAILRAPGISPVVPHQKNNPVALGGTLVAMNTDSSPYRVQEQAAPRGIFQVRTDATEVVPGGMLRLSALLRNPFPHTLSGLSVSARLSPETARVARLSTGGTEIRSGRILWQIPDLPPGESWTGRVALRLPENLPHGTDFRAVFSLEGPEAIRVLPLTERVASVHSTLLTTLPKTGVPFDIFLTVGGWLSAFFPFFLHRRLIVA